MLKQKLKFLKEQAFNKSKNWLQPRFLSEFGQFSFVLSNTFLFVLKNHEREVNTFPCNLNKEQQSRVHCDWSFHRSYF